MPERAEPRFASGLLLLADISGYTAFLERVTDAHPELAAGTEPVPPAYDFMITLLDLVADELQPTFRAVQTEGDALFAVADADGVTNRGREVLDTIGSTDAAYHARIEAAAANAGARVHRVRLHRFAGAEVHRSRREASSCSSCRTGRTWRGRPSSWPIGC